MSSSQKVWLIGLGAFSPAIAFLGILVGVPIVATVAKVAFAATWLWMLIDIVRQKRWDSSKKVGWFAAVFLIGVLAAPIYWWVEVRGAQKWSALSRGV